MFLHVVYKNPLGIASEGSKKLSQSLVDGSRQPPSYAATLETQRIKDIPLIIFEFVPQEWRGLSNHI